MKNRQYYILFLCFCLIATFPFSAHGEERKTFTVVIDPGHGGHDPGAIGRKSKEKNINLAVALKLGRLIENNCGDTHVIYTRKTDKFITLNRRAEIANNAKADLFISVHTNSVAKNRRVMGTETYTLGLHRTEENLEVAKKENAVILIEDDYKQRYAGFNPNSSESYIIFEFLQDKNMEKSVELATLIQKQFKTTARRIDKGVHQAGFLVLRETSMPGVLIELGYISTREEENYLNTESGTNSLANSIYNAFLQYKKNAKASQSKILTQSQVKVKETPSQPKTVQKKENKTVSPSKTTTSTTTSSKPVFKVQFLISNKKLSTNSRLLKGLSPVAYYKEKGIYKYTYGETTNYNKILQSQRVVRRKFKDAFIIAFKHGEKMNVHEAIKEFKRNK